MPTKTDYILVGIGGFLAVLATSYVPSLMKVMFPHDYANCPGCKETFDKLPSQVENYMSTIDSVYGIDLKALHIARQKGLM